MVRITKFHHQMQKKKKKTKGHSESHDFNKSNFIRNVSKKKRRNISEEIYHQTVKCDILVKHHLFILHELNEKNCQIFQNK